MVHSGTRSTWCSTMKLQVQPTMGKAPMVMSDDACRVCGKEDDEAFLMLCDGCDRPFHTFCHNGCVCCHEKPKGNFNRKPAVPDGDWFCKFCAGHIPALADGARAVSAVFAWGDNEDGQLGLPAVEVKAVWVPTRVHEFDGIGVVQLASTETSTLALCNDGNLYSAGTGPVGQLGHQDVVHEKLTKFRLLASMVEEKRAKIEGRFEELRAGRDFCMAITEHGHAYTWGNGQAGQLGHQENKNKKAPKKISALRELEISVNLASCGDDFIVMTSGEPTDDSQFNTEKPGVFMSMGANTHGQLGDGTGRNQWIPRQLNKDAPAFTDSASADIEDPSEFLLGRDIRILAAGKGHCVAALARLPGLWTWGFGELGQLGHQKPELPTDQSRFFRSQFRVPRPRFVKAFANDIVVQVACGGQHTLVLLSDGRLFGMGDNEHGQIGVPCDSKAEKKTVDLPVAITSFKDAGKIRQIVCGEVHSAALTDSGRVFTWGRGQYGQLGLGEQTTSTATPTAVPDIPSIKKLFAGPNQLFAIEHTNATIAPTSTAKASAVEKPAGKGATKKRGAPAGKASSKRGRGAKR